MVVIVLTACPAGLRGDLTRWLMEISPGVFVGDVSARVREALWDRVLALIKTGRATMAYSTSSTLPSRCGNRTGSQSTARG